MFKSLINSIFKIKPIMPQIDYKQQVEDYLNKFMEGNNIDPSRVKITDISTEERENNLLFINIKATYPGPLFGKGGATLTILARGLSVYLDKRARIQIN